MLEAERGVLSLDGLAQAAQELFPGTQVTIGPSIENGFYYDFARDEPFTPDDLESIEAKMKEIVRRNADAAGGDAFRWAMATSTPKSW